MSVYETPPASTLVSHASNALENGKNVTVLIAGPGAFIAVTSAEWLNGVARFKTADGDQYMVAGAALLAVYITSKPIPR